VKKTVTRVRVPVSRLEEGEHALGPDVARYLGRVRRLGPGDAFVAFDPERGLEADGEVVALTPGDLVARFGVVRAAELVATREVTWVQGLPKGEKMDGIIRDATELGATRIIPVTTEFTVVRLEGPKRLLRQARWERIAREAARQCGRSDAPKVDAIVPWAQGLKVTGGTGFCLYERATAPLAPLLRKALEEEGPIHFAAGPEGGLAPDEVREAAEAGFTVVSLGEFVLRAETVAAATLGALRVMERLA
jgi:16S rRNA (uracil1498-N3)-methyltransferase